MLYILYKFLHLELLMMFRQRNWGTCERRIAARIPHSDFMLIVFIFARKSTKVFVLLHTHSRNSSFQWKLLEQRVLAWVLCQYLKIVTYPRKLEGNTRSKTSIWKSPKVLCSTVDFYKVPRLLHMMYPSYQKEQPSPCTAIESATAVVKSIKCVVFCEPNQPSKSQISRVYKFIDVDPLA